MPLSSVVGASSILRPGVCTSTSRPASPFEGQTIYETDTDRLATWDGSAWIPYVRQTAGKVLQVVSTTKTDVSTTNSTTWSDISGLSVSVTPNFSSSTILVSVNMFMGTNNASGVGAARLMRGATEILRGDAAGSRSRVSGTGYAYGFPDSIAFSVLDSPATTSSTTYKVQFAHWPNGTYTTAVNRDPLDTDSADRFRMASTITVMEISG